MTFGNYKVALTVPNDHIVGATGELQNAAQVLTAEQQKRMEKAKTAAHPVLIVSQEEARKLRKTNQRARKHGFIRLRMCATLLLLRVVNLFGMPCK